MIVIYILVIVIFFIGGITIGYISFNDRYLRYKKYWRKLRRQEGKYRVSEQTAKGSDISVNRLMDLVENEIDNYNK